jgi:hypothetical protein
MGRALGTIAIVVPVTVVTPITVAVAVPAMVVTITSPIAFPIAFIPSLAIVPGCHPICTGIRGAGPVAIVPPVVVSIRIPVTVDPHVTGTGCDRADRYNAWGRRLADSDAY